MRQVSVLREETETNLVCTRILHWEVNLEGYKSSLALHSLHFEALGVASSTIARRGDYEVEAEVISDLLAIDNDSGSVRLTNREACSEILLRQNELLDLNGIPILGYTSLPCCDLLGELVVVGSKLASTCSFLGVEAIVVVVELTTHGEVRSDLVETVLDGLYPVGRIALAVLGEVQRNNLGLEHGVDGLSIELILERLVLERTLVGKSPTCALLVTLVPPAVEDGEVQGTIHDGLLARSTGSLQWTSWGVHPDVATRNETLGNIHVVVLDKDYLAYELRHTRNLDDATDQTLATAISWVSLACKDELNRTLGVVDNLGQTVEVGEEQVCTLIGSETTCEANGESIGIEGIDSLDDLGRILLLLAKVVGYLLLDEVEEFGLEALADLPDLLIVSLIDLFPHLILSLGLIVVWTKELLVELLPLAGSP